MASKTAKQDSLRHWTENSSHNPQEWLNTKAETAPFKHLMYKINDKMDDFTDS